MLFYYCTVCDHYHVADSRLPCYVLGRGSKKAVLMVNPDYVKKIRSESQQLLNSREVFLQTLRPAKERDVGSKN